MEKLIDQGDWGHSLFQVYLDLNGDFEKYRKSATGVFCVCFDENNNVVLANYEPLGGHIETGESVEEALKREALEEGGVSLIKWKYYGHYSIEMKDTASEEYKQKYPQNAFLLFFLAIGKKIREPYGNDVKSSQVMTVSEILSSTRITHKLLKEGVKLYPNYFISG